MEEKDTVVIEPYVNDSHHIDMVKNITLTAADRSVLTALEPVVDAVATLFGEHCEVLIHSLEDLSHSIIKIKNGGITGRTIGSPMTDLGIKALKSIDQEQSDVIGSYYSKTKDGKILKAVTAIIRNGTKPIGMLCINFNLSAPAFEIFQTFATAVQDVTHGESPENFMMNSEELVRRSLNAAIAQVGSNREISHQMKNKAIVSELHGQGIFDVKGAVDIVAKELKVSRYTIYNYIREVRV